jgi:hypothetical protein
MSVAIQRRTFLERLGLGVGATLFSPIAQTLVNEARGQVGTRKIWGLYMWDHGWVPENFRPQGAPPRPAKGAFVQAAINGVPAALAPLEKYRNRMVFLDGLTGEGYHSGSDHSLFHAALSCTKGQRTDRPGGYAGGMTIDHHIAGKIGGATPFAALRCGLNDTVGVPFDANTFAEGMGRSIQHHVDTKAFFDHAFKDFKSGTGAPDPAAAMKSSARRRVILDVARNDVRRLRTALAGSEAAKLDKYLGIIDEFEMRQSTATNITCKAPAAPGPRPTDGGTKRPINSEFESMAGMLTVAVACGLTNVFALTVGTGHGYHGFPVWESGSAGGHGDYSGPQRGALVFSSQQLAKMFDAFSSIKVGDKTLFDNMVFLMFSDNADQHHTVGRGNFPALVIGNGGGALKTDGRYLAWGAYAKPQATLLMSSAAAVGAPVEKWGNATAPIAELMA